MGKPNTNKWGPRAGIAWQVTNKTVVRGGYGLFWAPQIALGGPLATLGYANNTSYTGKSTKDVLTNPFPSGLLAPLGNPRPEPPRVSVSSPGRSANQISPCSSIFD